MNMCSGEGGITEVLQKSSSTLYFIYLSFIPLNSEFVSLCCECSRELHFWTSSGEGKKGV